MNEASLGPLWLQTADSAVVYSLVVASAWIHSFIHSFICSFNRSFFLCFIRPLSSQGIWKENRWLSCFCLFVCFFVWTPSIAWATHVVGRPLSQTTADTRMGVGWEERKEGRCSLIPFLWAVQLFHQHADERQRALCYRFTQTSRRSGKNRLSSMFSFFKKKKKREKVASAVLHSFAPYFSLVVSPYF